MSSPLRHSPADIMREVLIHIGQGTDPTDEAAWPVYVSSEPGHPDQVLTVLDTDPMDDGRSMIDGATWHHYGFRVRVRADDHKTGWPKGEAIHVALDEEVYDHSVTLNGSSYLVRSVSRTKMTTLGKESPNSRRSLFQVSATVAILPLY